MDIGIYLSMTSSICVEIFMDGENSFNFFKKLQQWNIACLCFIWFINIEVINIVD